MNDYDPGDRLADIANDMLTDGAKVASIAIALVGALLFGTVFITILVFAVMALSQGAFVPALFNSFLAFLVWKMFFYRSKRWG